MKNRGSLLRSLLLALPVLVASVAGCSSKGEDTTVAGVCTDDQCLPNNVCAGSPAECMLKCNKHPDCPPGFECHATAGGSGDGGTVTVCVKPAADAGAVAPLYSTACHEDPANTCGDGAFCNGELNELGAQCSKFDGCTADSDCPATEWCGQVRKRWCLSLAPDKGCTSDASCGKFGKGYTCVGFQSAPGGGILDFGRCQKTCKADADCDTSKSERCASVTPDDSVKRCAVDAPGDWCQRSPDSCPNGFTCKDKLDDSVNYLPAKACVPRTYCSPCKETSDCQGSTTACLKDSKGEGYCSDICSPSSATTCPTDATCQKVDGDFRCVPLGGTCHSDGSQCATCRGDADCGEGGFCLINPDSGENVCLARCAEDNTCPDTPNGLHQSCCLTGSTCGAYTGRCLPPTFSAVGNPRYQQSCWAKPCKDDTACDSTRKEVCWPRGKVCIPGKACTDDTGCVFLDGLYCDPTLAVCRPRPCTSISDCTKDACAAIGYCQGALTSLEPYLVCDATAKACFSSQ